MHRLNTYLPRAAGTALAVALLGFTSACSQKFSLGLKEAQLQAPDPFPSPESSPPPPVCKPVVGTVQPKESHAKRWKWETGPSPEYNQNMATPMVADINGDLVADFVFTTFKNGDYVKAGVLRVVSSQDGKEFWSTSGQPELNQPYGVAAPAIYDLDRDGKPEILVAGPGVNGAGALLVYSSTGTLIDQLPLAAPVNHSSLIAVADIDFDGRYELMIGIGVETSLYRYDFVAHTLTRILPAPVLGMMDVDAESPGIEVITATAIYSSALVKLRDLQFPSGTPQAVMAAFGNFDEEPDAEIVLTHYFPASIKIFKGKTGDLLRNWSEPAVDQEACKTRTGRNISKMGALNIGDIDGDGRADITFAGACWFRGLRNDPNGLHDAWKVETRDFSSSVTGSSIFDFNGDGRVEVLYNDELFFRIIDGGTGATLYQLRNDNGTLWENPVVASLRPDEPASIILSANSYTKYSGNENEDPESESPVNVTGIRVVTGSDNYWMPTRGIWNQFDYFVTQVLDNLQVPGSILDFVKLSDRTRANIPKMIQRCEWVDADGNPIPR